MFDVISYDANGNEDKVMANKLKQGFAKVYDNTCKECLGTGKREITFEDCFGKETASGLSICLILVSITDLTFDLISFLEGKQIIISPFPSKL